MQDFKDRVPVDPVMSDERVDCIGGDGQRLHSPERRRSQQHRFFPQPSPRDLAEQAPYPVEQFDSLLSTGSRMVGPLLLVITVGAASWGLYQWLK